MRFLRKFNKKRFNFSKNCLKLFKYLHIKKNKIDFSSKKKTKKLFQIGLDAFFTGKKLKMSKKIIGALIITLSFQLIGFSTPILAQNVLENEDEKQTVKLENGAILSDLEVELLNKNLVIFEKQDDEGKVDVFFPTNIDDAVNINSINTNKNEQFVSMGVRTLTSYNSEAAQTDDSPCITANGFNVCEYGIENTIAANFLKFGTKVKIPDIFGDRIFVVRDRMNERYSDRVDVWMVNKIDSQAFGVRRAEIYVLVE